MLRRAEQMDFPLCNPTLNILGLRQHDFVLCFNEMQRSVYQCKVFNSFRIKFRNQNFEQLIQVVDKTFRMNFFCI